MRVLVAGGTGFLGRPFVSELARVDGIEILVLSRSSVSSAERAVSHLVCDWREAYRDRRVLEFAPSIVVNMIGDSHPRSSVGQEAHEIETNVLPFFRLLGALKATGLQRALFCSSAGAIYRSALCPSEKGESDSAYFSTKRSIEHYLSSLTAATSLSAVSLRISNPVGLVDRRGFGIVNHFARAVVRGEDVEFIGDYDVAKDYIDIADVASALTAVVQCQWVDTGHSILDVGSGWATTAPAMHEMIQTIGRQDACDTGPTVQPADLGMVRSALSLEPILQMAGWAPQRNIVESIRAVYDQTLRDAM